MRQKGQEYLTHLRSKERVQEVEVFPVVYMASEDQQRLELRGFAGWQHGDKSGKSISNIYHCFDFSQN